MGNAFRIFLRDLKRLFKAPAALIVAGALLVLPSVYTWYNVEAFWNPYKETSNLPVCVVNEDAGVETELTGKLNAGDTIAEQVLENDRLDWRVTNRDEAMSSLRAGDAYAVFIVPKDFSESLVSPLTGNLKTPTLEYYTNEKLGPVSPKITDAAATTLDQTINATFVSTVAEAAVDAIDEAADKAKAELADSESDVSQRADDARTSVANVRKTLSSVQDAMEDARTKVASANEAFDGAAKLDDDTQAILQDVTTEANAIQESLSKVASDSISSLSDVTANVAQVTSKASTVADNIATKAGSAQADVDMAAAKIQKVVDAMEEAAADMRTAANALPGDSALKDDLTQTAQDMEDRAQELQSALDGAVTLAERAGDTAQAASDATQSLNDASQQVASSLQDYSDGLYGSAASAVTSSVAQVGAACARLSASVSSLDAAVQQARPVLDKLDGILADCGVAVGKTDTLIGDTQDDLETVMSDARALAQSSIIANLLENGTLNSKNISEFMGSPTQLKQVELFAPSSYGTAMAPLFMNLTFWIGAFMLMIIFRLEVDSEGFEGLKPWQRYFGRFLLFGIFSIGQAVICCTGTLILGVEVVNVPVFYIGSIVAALAYLSIIYALSSTFRHIGKALCVVLVFAQIPGGSGLYPVEMTSSFFQALCPFLPFTYGIDAVREGIGGLYGFHFAHDLVILGLFFIGNLIVGALLGSVMSNVVRMTAHQVREGDLYAGEDVVTPERPYRLGQVLRALSEKEEYRAELERRHNRFLHRYPLLIHGAVVAGVIVPAVLAALLALDAAEKVMLLTMVLAWLVAIILFLVIVESHRYSLERQLDMEGMSDAGLLNLFSRRNHMVHSSLHVTKRRRATAEDADASDGEKAATDEPETAVEAAEPDATAPETADAPATASGMAVHEAVVKEAVPAVASSDMAAADMATVDMAAPEALAAGATAAAVVVLDAAAAGVAAPEVVSSNGPVVGEVAAGPTTQLAAVPMAEPVAQPADGPMAGPAVAEPIAAASVAAESPAVEPAPDSSEKDGSGPEPATRKGFSGLRNVWLVAQRDLRALNKNVMSTIITVGLVVLPSLFAWYNILACWNVFDNTGNLSVAVASKDVGYTSELFPLSINVGDKVVSALRANDDINWVFTDPDDAVEGTKDGKYYAALVIPEGFSKDLLTFYEGDSVSATIDYYVNEKKNAISPNITGMGADTVSYTVNETFAETISEVAVVLAQSLTDLAEEKDAAAQIGKLADSMRRVADRLDQSADVLELYSSLDKDSQSLLEGANDTVKTARLRLQDASNDIDADKQRLRDQIASLSDSVSNLGGLLDSASDAVSDLQGKTDTLLTDASADADDVAARLREKAAEIDEKAQNLSAILTTMENLRDELKTGAERGTTTTVPGDVADVELSVDVEVMLEDTLLLDKSIAALTNAIEILDKTSSACNTAADDLESGSADVQGRVEDLRQFAASARADVDAEIDDLGNNLAPGIEALKADVDTLLDDLEQGKSKLSNAGTELVDSVDSAAEALGDASTKVDGACGKLRSASQSVRDIADALNGALASGDIEKLRSLLLGDADDLASALTAPVKVERTALFPSANFGSSMTPLYCTLALFIGSLLIMVAMKVEVSPRGRERLFSPKPRQLYFGRFIAVAALSLMQSTLMGLGTMLFLKVQVVEPLLFMLAYWFSGLVFAFIIYTLVVAFRNLGKAIAVLLLIVQVTGCNGSYPVQILPEFVQAINPWVPAAYIVKMIQSAMMGVYMNDFWVAMGHLALFLVPFLLLGLVLRKPLERFMKFYVSKVEECGIME